MRKTPQQKLEAARINRAIIGYQIPVLIIPALYRRLQVAVAEGQTDEDLAAIVGAADGVIKTD